MLKRTDRRNVNKKLIDGGKIMKIEQMGFTIRTHSCLHRAGLTTLEKITERSENDLKKVRNLGDKGNKRKIKRIRLFS